MIAKSNTKGRCRNNYLSLEGVSERVYDIRFKDISNFVELSLYIVHPEGHGWGEELVAVGWQDMSEDK